MTFVFANCSKKNITVIPTFSLFVRRIDLSRNSLKFIPANTSLPKDLLSLDVSNSDIKYIELGAFRQLNALQYLDISFNQELTLNVLPNITDDLINSSIKVLKLNSIQCPVGRGTTLRYQHLCRLQNTSLQEIQLSRNRIDMVESYTLRVLPRTLTSVSAAENFFRPGLYLFEFSMLDNLQNANFSYLYSQTNPFRHLSNLFCHEHQHPAINVSTLSQCKMPQEVNIEIHKDNFANQENIDNWFSNVSLTVYMPSNLKSLHLENCVIRDTRIHRNLRIVFPSLTSLYGRRNFIPFVSGVDFNRSLQIMDLTCVYIHKIETTFLQSCNLSKLILAKNYLGEQFSKKETKELFRGQNFLSYLDLSNNHLVKVAYDLFEYTPRLEHLDLSGNDIEHINFKLNHLKDLCFLNISFTKVKSFNDDQMENLDSISQSGN